MLARGEIELGPHRARVLYAQPVENALISRALALGGQIEDIAVFLADLLGAQIHGRIIDGVVGARHVAVGGVAGEAFQRRDADGPAGVGKIDPHIVAQHQQMLAFFARA